MSDYIEQAADDVDIIDVIARRITKDHAAAGYLLEDIRGAGFDVVRAATNT